MQTPLITTTTGANPSGQAAKATSPAPDQQFMQALTRQIERQAYVRPAAPAAAAPSSRAS